MSKRTLSKKAKLLVIFIALLILSIPASSQTDNCCFVDRQCNTDEQWVSGYWAYQNNECAAPSQQQQSQGSDQPQQSSSSQSQPRTETSEDTDNCCFIGWQCDTDQDWASGYSAFQNDQCDSQSQSQQSQGSDQPQQSSSSQSQPRTETSEDTDNCCFIGWQCDTDQEWASGYSAFQNDQCDSQSQSQGNNQPQQQNSDQPQQRNNNQPQQNNNQPPQQPDDDPQAECCSILIDHTDPDPEPTETEDGTPVVIVPMTDEFEAYLCSLYPRSHWCQVFYFPRLND